MIYYLKTTDEQAMWSALEVAGLAVKDYDPEDPLNQQPADIEPDTGWQPSGAFTWRCTAELDIIGSIYKPTGQMVQGEDGEYPEMAAIEGFHANLRTDSAVSGLPTVDEPATPYRVWAGQ